MENSEPKPSRTSWREHLQALGRDAVAGGVASIVIVANIVSFGTLMFPGDLAAGAASAVWAMLAGAAICGAWIALATTLPPLATGIDSPTGAVLVVLGGSVAAGTLNGGGSAAAAVQSVMLVFSIATAITGALLFGLGALRLGAYFRFVPYFVVAGFLAATGWFLIAGGLRMTTGRALSIGGLAAPWTAAEAVRLAAATATLGVLLGVRRWVKFRLALPAALVLSWVVFVLALRAFDLTAPVHGWYPPSLGALAPWAPLAALARVELPWSMAGRLALETGAVAIVALISLVTKVSTLEVGRKTAGDLDRELRAHGLSSLAAAPLGGITSALQTGTSRLLEHAGAASRWSGVACAAVTGTIALTQFDLLGIVPTPLVAGLVMYLGITFLLDALAKPVAQRAWASVLLAMAIAAACVEYGYVAGVLGGVVCACLLFAVSYARIGAVRQHLTRTQFASYVSRSAEASRHLAEAGDAIQIYRLAGYVFFGSSEGVFERVRRDIHALPPRRVRFVILDFGMVSGADASATGSLAKLRNLCQQQRATLVYCGLSAPLHAALAREGFFAGPHAQHVFPALNPALAWCEDRLLEASPVNMNEGVEHFEPWLAQQLGGPALAADLIACLERRDIDGARVLYREGDAADHIDFVAAGTLVVDLDAGDGRTMRVRSIRTRSVVGEMGFFRRSPRSATVSTDGAATLFTLTRERFERLRRDHPEVGNALEDFLLRVLADRITLSERMVAALSR